MTDLTTTMDALVECVCSALEGIDRAACECGLTIGVPAQGPAGCCNCGDTTGGTVSGFLERTYPADGVSLEQVTRYGACAAGPIAADLSFTVVRCYPSINSQGKMPDLETTTPYAHNLNTDIAAVWNALNCCGYKVAVREAVVEGDPEGGCAGFAVRVTVLVSMPNPVVDVS